MLDARHGGKRLGIKPKQPALEAGEVQNLVPTLATLREAVNAEPDRLQLGLRPLDVLQELERVKIDRTQFDRVPFGRG